MSVLCSALNYSMLVKAFSLPQPCFVQRFYKKAAAFVLRAVGKHSPQLAQEVVQCGALEMLVICLEDFDPGVKEAACWTLGCIARHNSGNSFHMCCLSA